MTIGERFELIINELHLKKSDIAKTAMISPAAVTYICNGTSNPSKQTVTLICKEYGINETWLLTGEGEMIAPASKEQEISQITAQLFSESDDSFRYKLIKLVSQMSEDEIKMCKEFIEKLNN